MRARLALLHCGAICELREVVLKNKPAHMLDVSSKGTVPVLVVPIEGKHASGSVADSNGSDNGTTASYRVIEQSIDIMRWAINENPSRHLQNAEQWQLAETMTVAEINALIAKNDFEFKVHLDKYKYSDRHPEHPQAYYFEQAKPFLEKLEALLTNSSFLSGSQFRMADAAILPFVRQFSMVDATQFNALSLPNLQRWLLAGIESDLFTSVMDKFVPWHAESSENLIVFGDRYGHQRDNRK